MHSGNFKAGSAQLQKALEKVQIVWENTQDHWKDVNSRKFEEDVLKPLIEAVGMSLDATQMYSTVVHRAERDCSEEAREW